MLIVLTKNELTSKTNLLNAMIDTIQKSTQIQQVVTYQHIRDISSFNLKCLLCLLDSVTSLSLNRLQGCCSCEQFRFAGINVLRFDVASVMWVRAAVRRLLANSVLLRSVKMLSFLSLRQGLSMPCLLSKNASLLNPISVMRGCGLMARCLRSASSGDIARAALACRLKSRMASLCLIS